MFYFGHSRKANNRNAVRWSFKICASSVAFNYKTQKYNSSLASVLIVYKLTDPVDSALASKKSIIFEWDWIIYF